MTPIERSIRPTVPTRRIGTANRVRQKPYIKHASRYLRWERAEEAVRDGWYELLRNWALGTTLREALRC